LLLPDPLALPLVPAPVELVPPLFAVPAVECDVVLFACDLDFDLLELLCLVVCGLVVLALAEPVPLFTAAFVPDGLELVALAPDPFAVAVLPPAVVAADPVVLPAELWASATPAKHASVPAIRRYESLRFIAWILSCRRADATVPCPVTPCCETCPPSGRCVRIDACR
jgi:hypothetical protein